MRYIHGWLMLGLGALLAGCASVRPAVPVEQSPQAFVEEQALGVRDAQGFAVIGMGSSVILPSAYEKALRRGRFELAEIVLARLALLQEEFLKTAGLVDDAPVDALFSGIQAYLQDMIQGGALPVLERTQEEDGLATVWMLLTEDPGVILQALEVRGAADRQLLELIRASQAYRALLLESEQYGAYRLSQGRTSLF
jgi:hypothetical protein